MTVAPDLPHFAHPAVEEVGVDVLELLGGGSRDFEELGQGSLFVVRLAGVPQGQGASHQNEGQLLLPAASPLGH